MNLAGHNILLLQGPMGPFFWWLARDLRGRGANVHKVNFNAGDALFYPVGGLSFRGAIDEWAGFLESLIRDNSIDEIVLFGDCRAYHRVAISVACRKGIAVRVFEEGYLRPDWITLEKGGVNGNSFLPTDFQSGADEGAYGDLAGEVERFLGLGMDGFFTDQANIGVQARDAFVAGQ